MSFHRCHKVAPQHCHLEMGKGSVGETNRYHTATIPQQNMEDATKYPPLPLFLKDGHYRTLKPGLAHRIPSGMLATTEVEVSLKNLSEAGCHRPHPLPNRIAAGCPNHPQPAPKPKLLPSLTKAGSRPAQDLHHPAGPNRDSLRRKLPSV